MADCFYEARKSVKQQNTKTKQLNEHRIYGELPSSLCIVSYEKKYFWLFIHGSVVSLFDRLQAYVIFFPYWLYCSLCKLMFQYHCNDVSLWSVCMFEYTFSNVCIMYACCCFFAFYPRDAMLARSFPSTDVCLSVRPFVRLSVRHMPVLCLNS